MFKKLNYKNIKFTIIKVINFYNYRLNIFIKIHNIFYITFLRFITNDSFFSQIIYNNQSLLLIIKREEEYKIKTILNKRVKKISRKSRFKFLIK